MIWRLIYCNKKGVEARIDIIRGDRTTVEVVQGSGNPFTMSYRLDKTDKSGHIMTSSADIEIFETETFNIDDLKTSNETELKVEYFEANVLTWSGFILPDFFSREIGSPNIVRMTASDRLTALKGVTLSDLPSKVSLRDLIELSLAQTGLALSLASQIQINQGSTNILDSEVLSQRLTDVRGRSISCYDILMSIMVGTNSTIRQRAGQWQVYNKLEHELRTPTIFFDKVERGAIRTIQPVASSVGVYQEFGGGKPYPDNYDFSDGLTGWTAEGGFVASTNDKEILGYSFIYNLEYGTETVPRYFVNTSPYSTTSFLRTDSTPSPYTSGEVEVSATVNAIGPYSNTNKGRLMLAIVAIKGGTTLYLKDGSFSSATPHIHEHLFEEWSPTGMVTLNVKLSGKIQNPSGYVFQLRMYGSMIGQVRRVTTANFAQLEFKSTSEVPKGTIHKVEQGSNFTKLHDVETTIFGDYIRKGLNGYFYNYPIDDSSNLYLPNGELSSPIWKTVFDLTERSLLHHVSRQKGRLFSVAHDILKANINVESFDPLAVFQDCKDGRYVVVSASFDFLRSEVNVELEQIAYDNAILKRDFIYSYFGEGEDTIKSIGGITGDTGVGGGLTADQIELIGGIREKVDEVEERVNNSRVGVANLLRNTGFLGDFQPLNVDYLTALENSSPIDTNPLRFWIHSDTSVIDAPSRSGKGIRIGSIQQNVVLKIGEPYVLSFWAKGTSLIVDIVDTIEIPLTSEYERYSFDIVASETKEYTFTLIDNGNTAEVYEIMLSNGNAKVSYSYAEEDDVKAISQIQAINTIINAIKTGKTEILGGLILSTMIQLGKYKDDVMEKVTSGINGIYNNDDDPAIWAGGSFDDAIRTVQKFIDNPNIEPTEAEWAEMANIVFTHGGDGFFRGYIYALGGYFRGKIETSIDGHRVVIDPTDKSIKMVTAEDRTVLAMKFNEESTPLGSFSGADIKLYTYDGAGDIVMQSELSSKQVTVSYIQNLTGFKRSYSTNIDTGGLSAYIVDYDHDDPNITPEVGREFAVRTSTSSGNLEISTIDLPTSGDGLDPGIWYSDNGTIKIKQ